MELDSTCCGPLSGTLAERRVAFTFPFDSLGDHTYGTDVTLSDDMQRIGGSFSPNGSSQLKVIWVRSEDAQQGAPEPLQQVLVVRGGRYELRLASQFVGRFEPLEPRNLSIGFESIASDFGVFHWGDMTWDSATETLTVGPVPATDPSFASELELQYQGNELQTVIVTYPEDPPYFFDASSSP